jgi:hypothetical protein
MLALFRFLICIGGMAYLTMAAIRAYQGKATALWSALAPRDEEDFRKRYGDRTPY